MIFCKPGTSRAWEAWVFTTAADALNDYVVDVANNARQVAGVLASVDRMAADHQLLSGFHIDAETEGAAR